jgi:hypothetical protein
VVLIPTRRPNIQFPPTFQKFTLDYHLGIYQRELTIESMRNLESLIDFVVSHGHLDPLAVQIKLVSHEHFISALQDNEDFSRAIAHFDQLMKNSHFQCIRTRKLSFDSRKLPVDESNYSAQTTLIKALLPLLDKEGILSFGNAFHDSKILVEFFFKLQLITNLDGTEVNPNIFGHL